MCPVIPRWRPLQRSAGRLASRCATGARRRRSARSCIAGREMLRETSYADLTVRAVAKRANVAPATAYTYFSSKNHLVAEVYLELIKQVPFFTDVNDTLLTRVDSVLRHLALVVADDPEVAAACTTALMSGQDVRGTQGARPHRGRDPSPHRVGHRTGRRRTDGQRTGDDLLRRTGPGRQRRLHLPPDRRPTDLRGQPDPPWRRRGRGARRRCATRGEPR